MPKNLVPLQISPGYRDGTDYEAGASWIRGNLIRWHEGRLKPMRPWRKMFTTPISGSCRGMHYWTASNGMRYLALATQTNVYIVDIVKNELRDITPLSGLDTSDTFNLGPGYGGDVYGGEYNYSEAANLEGLNFIFSDYARWSMDNWGDFLVAMKEGDGQLWLFDPTTAGVDTKLSVVVTDADPLRARGLIVTAERYVMLYGEGGIPRRLRWSAEEDYTTWISTTANPTEAGYLDISTKGFLMAAKKVRAGILIFSNVDVHLCQYLGPPYIYGIESLAEACGPVSSASIQQIAERTVWLATDGFWVFDGNVTPLPCPILETFLNDIDMQRGTLCSAGAIREYGEVIWFYCSKENATSRPDAYILWGTRNNTWSIGRLSREAFQEEEAFVFPIAVGPDTDNLTYIWAHEVDRSLAYEPNALAYAETGALEIEQGRRLARVSRIWHDIAKQGEAGNYPTFSFYRSASADSDETLMGPYSPNPDGSIDLRFQARQIRLRVEAPISDEWTLGKQRLELQPGGTR